MFYGVCFLNAGESFIESVNHPFRLEELNIVNLYAEGTRHYKALIMRAL